MFKPYYPLQLNDMRRFDYKFSPIFDFFNEILPQLKTPDRDFPIVFDESLRGSYSKSNPLRQYMPNKPRKFGDLLYQTNDSDGFCLQAHLLKPEQFRKHKGLSDLVEKMLPSRFRNLGYTICADNLFITVPQILIFQKENTAVICTMRKNRISRYFPKNDFENLTKNLSNRNF